MKHIFSSLFMLTLVMMSVVGCRSSYEMASLERTRILVDSRYDKPMDKEVADYILPYQARVDSIMNPVIGRAGNYLYAAAPESPLSNLLPDILVWSGKHYDEKPEFGVYNLGGMRAAIAEGDVTIGDVYAVAPFENRICFLTLSGRDVKSLLREIAGQFGQGVSREVKMLVGKDGELKEATISGQPIDENRDYRVVTIDYVAQGNNRMTSFLKKKNVNQPEGENDNVRFVIIDYFKEQTRLGRIVTQGIEGRIVVE